MHEETWLSMPETVDALLYIANHEQRVVGVMKGLNDGILNGRDILAFIYIDIGIGLLKVFPDFRMNQVGHQAISHLFHIGKVNDVGFLFLCAEQA